MCIAALRPSHGSNLCYASHARLIDRNRGAADGDWFGRPRGTLYHRAMDDDRARALDTGPLVLFDGLCNLCSWSVQVLAPRDRDGRLWFAPVQSEAGRAVLARHGLPTLDPDSFVLLEDGRVHVKSQAFFQVVRYMGGAWPLLRMGSALPRRWADWLYDRVARNRYRLFGRKAACMIPPPSFARRFLG